MAIGLVKWFDAKKGFGFIVQDDSNEDIFAHYSQIQGEGFRTLNDGERVEFELIQGDKGLQAQNIKRVEA